MKSPYLYNEQFMLQIARCRFRRGASGAPPPPLRVGGSCKLISYAPTSFCLKQILKLFFFLILVIRIIVDNSL